MHCILLFHTERFYFYHFVYIIYTAHLIPFCECINIYIFCLSGHFFFCGYIFVPVHLGWGEEERRRNYFVFKQLSVKLLIRNAIYMYEENESSL